MNGSIRRAQRPLVTMTLMSEDNGIGESFLERAGSIRTHRRGAGLTPGAPFVVAAATSRPS